MKGHVLRLAVLLAAFVVGVVCFVAFRRRTPPCVPLDPPDSQVQILDKTTGRTFWVKTCPR
jgi:hypothetical protein